jgi:hypothetical protein
LKLNSTKYFFVGKNGLLVNGADEKISTVETYLATPYAVEVTVEVNGSQGHLKSNKIYFMEYLV